MTAKKIVFIRIIVFMAFFGTIVFFASIIYRDYKTYADSEVLNAEVVDIGGTKSGMLNIKYKYSFGGQNYEERAIQSSDNIQIGDAKKIRIQKSSPQKILSLKTGKVIIFDIAIVFTIFTFFFEVIVLMEAYVFKRYKKPRNI